MFSSVQSYTSRRMFSGTCEDLLKTTTALLMSVIELNGQTIIFVTNNKLKTPE